MKRPLWVDAVEKRASLSTRTGMETEGAARWKQNPYLDLPSKEHRGHIRRFRGLTDLSDEDDVRLRHFIAWKRWNFALMSAAAAKNNTGERPNMTSKQLCAALNKLGLKQVELAELFGIAESTVGRYAKDGVTNVPTAILRHRAYFLDVQ
jgi:hypothetical protein